MESSAIWDPGRSRLLGTSMRRLEDWPLITGAGSYVGDRITDEDLHARFHRSPIAHGDITGVDLGGAAATPGVGIVATEEDLGLEPIPGPPGAARERMSRPLLARDKVRYVGEPIVVVAAETAAQATDATERIWVDIEPLPVLIDPERAEDGPALFEGGNLVARVEPRSPGGESYPVSAVVKVRNQRLAPAPIEGLAIRVEPSGLDGLIVTCGHQAPHLLRDQLAAQLGIDTNRLRVVVPDVGGGFGFKGGLFPEYVVVAELARRTGRPVVWEETRREHFANGTHGRSMIHQVTLEGEEDGNIRRARIEILADAGAYPRSGALMPDLARFVAQGLYEIDEVLVGSQTVVTNQAPVGSYRGAGRPEAAYAIERAVDAFAWAAGVDPAQVRAVNLIEAGNLPYNTVNGATYDSGDYPAALQLALATVGIEEVRARQRERLDTGADPIGVGIGAFIERAGGAADSGEFGMVQMSEGGRIEVATGSTPAGQGHRTVWTQTVAEVFGVDPEDVSVTAGDTGPVAAGVGTYGSRSAQAGASAVFRMADAVAERVKELAAGMLEAAVPDLRLNRGRVEVVGDPGSSVTLAEVVERSREAGLELEMSEMFVPGTQTFPYGIHVAVVEVERETGVVTVLDYVAVDDCGNVLNPMVVEGQVHGALAQGVGQALFEGIEYTDTGDPLTSSFMDYLVPGAGDVPSFTTRRTVTPAPSNPLGVKGTGEAGCIGAPPAIVNAALDALRPLGVSHLDMPLRPHRVWTALEDAAQRGD
ncbi:MAG: xanthine dehydrogenase family protein molybdopterin-binding subunit [Actinobacteria bacterium]|nr:xanthine dehydrogenase family protein molybdopterin-binding subunit [Actinomycetota bacterium]